MRLGIVVFCFLYAHLCAVFAHSSEAEAEAVVGEFSVRAIDKNASEIFPTLMTLIEAKQALEFRDFERAYELFAILEKYDADLDGVRVGLAKSLIALGRPDLAREHLRNADEYSSEMETLLILTTAMLLTDFEAETYLNENVHAQEDSRLWNLLALKLADQGKMKRAKEAFHRAEALGQSRGLLQNNLGVLAMKSGNFKRAVDYLSEGHSRAPHNIKFDNNRRLGLLLDQQYSEALTDLPAERLSPLLEDAASIAKKMNRPHLEYYLRNKAIETQLTYIP